MEINDLQKLQFLFKSYFATTQTHKGAEWL